MPRGNKSVKPLSQIISKKKKKVHAWADPDLEIWRARGNRVKPIPNYFPNKIIIYFKNK